MNNDRKDQQGFTLMEVLVATLITTFVILTVTSLFFYSTHQVSSGRNDTVGALYAQEKIEDLMHAAVDASELAAGFYADTPEDNYLRQWQIYQDNPAVGSKLIIVKVRALHKDDAKPVVFAAIRQ
ncbi:prepilin-type N-terminal cleavage/methylation domain-containing protein [Acidobacteriota bacterium]